MVVVRDPSPELPQPFSELNLTSLQTKTVQYFSATQATFDCRKGIKMDDCLSKLLKKQNVRIPVIHIKDNQYLVGSLKLNLELKNQTELMLVHRGLKKNLEKFLTLHEFKIMELLYSEVKETKSTLSNVCTRILKGMKLRSTRSVEL